MKLLQLFPLSMCQVIYPQKLSIYFDFKHGNTRYLFRPQNENYIACIRITEHASPGYVEIIIFRACAANLSLSYFSTAICRAFLPIFNIFSLCELRYNTFSTNSSRLHNSQPKPAALFSSPFLCQTNNSRREAKSLACNPSKRTGQLIKSPQGKRVNLFALFKARQLDNPKSSFVHQFG